MKAEAVYSNLPVYRDCYAVALEFAKARGELPRDTRYTIGQDLSRALVAMMVTIYRANSSRADKARLIGELRRMAVEVQIYFRLLGDLRQLGARREAFFMEKVASIGKQLAAWHKSALREGGKGGTGAARQDADIAGGTPAPPAGGIMSNGAEPPSLADGRPECGGPRRAAASRMADPMCGRAARAAMPAAKGGLAETTEETP